MGLNHKALPLGPCCCLKSMCHQEKSCVSWQLSSWPAHCKLNQGITAPKPTSYHSLCWRISITQVQVLRGAVCSMIPLWARRCRIYKEMFYFTQCQGNWENSWEKVNSEKMLLQTQARKCWRNCTVWDSELSEVPFVLLKVLALWEVWVHSAGHCTVCSMFELLVWSVLQVPGQRGCTGKRQSCLK